MLQGLGYYNRFIERYPDLVSLAVAKIDDVMKIWQGLGYYSRARHLHNAANFIMDNLGGKIPETYTSLLRIKGIGQYTAAAIASFAYKEPVPVVDGNVFRVLSRLFMIEWPAGSARGKREAIQFAGKILDPARPDIHNQAMMEFGALQCKPGNPNCNPCILNSACQAFLKKKVDTIPSGKKKVVQHHRYFNYLVVLNGNKILLRKRVGNDIWKYLYDFPLIETSVPSEPEEIYLTSDWKSLSENSGFTVRNVSETVHHVLSHQRIHARFFIISSENLSPELENKFHPVTFEKLGNYAIPRLIENFLASYTF